MKKTSPVLVIGGGPAGTACAIQLAELGAQVHLAEKTAFPRDKVCGCCLGGSGIETLGRLGLADWTVANGIGISRWSACIDGRAAEMPLPAGVAISRAKLDTQLLQVAQQRGVVVHRECEGLISTNEDLSKASDQSMTGNAFSESPRDTGAITATLNGEPQRFCCVVLAAGLNAAGGQRVLPWTEKPHGPFGVSLTVASNDLVKAGVIYMVCDGDGYVGLVQLESGRIDIAAAIQSGSNASRGVMPIDRVKNILDGSPFSGLGLDGHSKIMTTPPLRRTRIAGRGRVLAIGDSAGYVEPFTGEGMTWAMKSGIAAASCITENAADLSQVGEDWARRSARLLRSQKRTCRVLTSALNWSPTRRLIGFGLSTMPMIARPLVARLNR